MLSTENIKDGIILVYISFLQSRKNPTIYIITNSGDNNYIIKNENFNCTAEKEVTSIFSPTNYPQGYALSQLDNTKYWY